ncbi:hypothetical protein GOP47_0013030 [Adiantum capillus-veneris]|uniref:Uncharacterized protein n=1 Tax=Adiantum capillus-veneris TaxID=13818 RepID=A0A9D4ZEY3_ADICA|nr:hypothetical protein GOP47_0013030 [Adiantum capillus-veneris]
MVFLFCCHSKAFHVIMASRHEHVLLTKCSALGPPDGLRQARFALEVAAEFVSDGHIASAGSVFASLMARVVWRFLMTLQNGEDGASVFFLDRGVASCGACVVGSTVSRRGTVVSVECYQASLILALHQTLLVDPCCINLYQTQGDGMLAHF